MAVNLSRPVNRARTEGEPGTAVAALPDLGQTKLPEAPHRFHHARLGAFFTRLLGIALSLSPNLAVAQQFGLETKAKLPEKRGCSPGKSPEEGLTLKDFSLSPAEKPDVQRASRAGIAPDECCISLGLIHPDFKTPGKPWNYIQEYFGEENPLSFLGNNTVLPPRLELRYFINPDAKHPSLAFVDFASANASIDGDVKFWRIPFKYSMREETYRIGLGLQRYFFPRKAKFNVSVKAAAHVYHGKISIKGESPVVWTEEFHNRGFGGGVEAGLTIERKIGTEGGGLLPPKTWLFFELDYSRAQIADFAEINGPSVFVGLRFDLGK